MGRPGHIFARPISETYRVDHQSRIAIEFKQSHLLLGPEGVYNYL